MKSIHPNDSRPFLSFWQICTLAALLMLLGTHCRVSPPMTVVETSVEPAQTAPAGHPKVISQDTTTNYAARTSLLMSGTIPDSVFEMLELRSLHIQGDDCDVMKVDENGHRIIDCWMISKIPAEIQNLKKLEYLGLNVNAISELPAEIAALHSLKTLYLDDNSGLSQIDAVVQLDSLEELSLNGCYIQYMPHEIGKLKRLKRLGLVGNPIDAAEQARIKAALPHCEIYF